jgi:hypothetical protein
MRVAIVEDDSVTRDPQIVAVKRTADRDVQVFESGELFCRRIKLAIDVLLKVDARHAWRERSRVKLNARNLICWSNNRENMIGQAGYILKVAHHET